LNTELDNIEKYNETEANSFLKNIILIAIGLIVSFLFVRTTLPHQNSSSKFDELMDVINKNYVDSINLSNVENKAVNNLLNYLDPHSVYISKEDIQAANEPLEGNFSGVGIEFYIVKDTIVVVSPIAGSPSELVGIKSGDKIIKINDTIVVGVKITNADVFKKLRGKKDTKVKITIQRGAKVLSAFILKRDNIQVNSVEKGFKLDTITGYIKVNTFGENTYNEFYTELETLKKGNIQNLVLDLRQNTGGFLEIAVAILDELIDEKKLLVFTEGMHYSKEQYFTKKKGLFEEGKLVVLIDEGSASASEIVAGAVQDLDRGLIVGRRSFGKGLVQNQISLSDGSAVRLTVAKYFTPSGRNIQKPYKSNDHYEDEINDRYKSGELFKEDKQAAGDTTVYLTSNGRKVKGGGGIFPDYFVALDTSYDYVSLSTLRNFVPDFVYSNFDKFSTQINQYKSMDEFILKYNVDATTLSNFYKYANQNGGKWSANKSNYEDKLKQIIKSIIAKQFYKSEGLHRVQVQKDAMINKSIQLFNHKKK
jgi:carboxyl-terminal processing protease